MSVISRQEAIDVCNYAIDLWHGQLGEGIVIAVRKKIAELPSAQPEIIMCKDCEHYKKEHGWNCIDYMVCAISPIHTVIRKPDDYCSRAERRTDEQTKD